MMNYSSWIRIALASTICFLNMGCAVSRLSKRPSKKNLGILDVGTPRSRVIAELGTPGATSDKAGEKVDSFAFDPGVSGGMKFARGFFHVGADLFTLFLWELVAWPSEIAAGDSKKKIDVAYDLEDRVKTVTDWTKGR